MTCWMCHVQKVKQTGRCKQCKETRCIACGQEFKVFVRMIHAMKFRKRQWKNDLYERETFVKTRTFERLCVNPECARYWNPAKLPPQWQLVEGDPVKKDSAQKKTFEDAMRELESII